ncbi:hypothetical protein Arth_0457 [Arthrobacter sp. FB24]|uniref:hypothetical protein n=1 Tax=Arthrobacter sp. (strain FB24) TaxID=290399 RepID=UPI0000526ABF|nr:hypothetical protein [Arthrobacter sp. FB24]ABK01857.1 hypothetical protein Arth_0457 [Arthrobacter sp. FB24]
MMTWWNKHPILLTMLVLALGWGFVLAVQLVFGDSFDEAAVSATFWVICVAAVWYVFLRRRKKTEQRLADAGQVLMYLRYPDSRPGSLSGIWNMGVATLAPRTLHFQPSVYDNLEPSGRAVVLTGLEVASPPRSLNRQDKKHVPQFLFQAMTLSSDAGTIEVAASPATLEKVRQSVIAPPAEN